MSESGKIGIRQARAGEARQRLLRSAARLFSRRPYETVEVDDIVAGAGMAHGSLFHHFGSKRGIYLAAMEEIAARLRARRADYRRAGGDGLLADMEAQYGSIAENPAFFASLMRGGIGADADVQRIFERDRWAAIEAKARQLGLEAGNPAVRITLRAWIASADQMALTWLELGRPFPLPHLVASFLPTLSGALASIVVLDPSVDISAARALLNVESARFAVRRKSRRAQDGGKLTVSHATSPSSPRVARGGGAVIRDGGVMGDTYSVARDPSVAIRRRHLPALRTGRKKD